MRDNAKILAIHTSEVMKIALSMYQKNGFVYYSKADNIHGLNYSVYIKKL